MITIKIVFLFFFCSALIDLDELKSGKLDHVINKVPAVLRFERNDHLGTVSGLASFVSFFFVSFRFVSSRLVSFRWIVMFCHVVGNLSACYLFFLFIISNIATIFFYK